MLELIAQINNQPSRERLIATGRLVLSSVSLLAIYLDPSEPSRYAGVAYAILSAYVFYAVGVCVLLQILPAAPARLSAATHGVDLGAFFILAYFTEGATSPFFVFFVFSLICAAIRWQWRGTLWTGLTAISGFIAMGIYTAEVLQDPGFELNRFLIRSVYLAVLVVLLGYLGTHRLRLQRQLAGLVAWPANFRNPDVEFFRELLQNSVGVIGADRAILVWEEQSCGTCHAGSFVNGEFRWLNEAGLAPRSLVAEPLATASFFCNALLKPLARVIYASPDGVETWYGAPLSNEFQTRFAVESTVLSAVLRGVSLEGRVWFIGKRGISSDDLILVEILSYMLATRIDNWQLLKKSQEVAAREERIRLADALHSSVFQSLAAAGLQMEIIGQLLQKDPEGVRDLLSRTQQRLFDGTREMRSIMADLKGTEKPQIHDAPFPTPGEVEGPSPVSFQHGRSRTN
jgi:signal transduction histidine kinase